MAKHRRMANEKAAEVLPDIDFTLREDLVSITFTAKWEIRTGFITPPCPDILTASYNSQFPNHFNPELFTGSG